MAGPKVLAQVAGDSAATLVTAYTSPTATNGGKGTVLSSIVCANTNNTGYTAEVRVAAGGAANASVHVAVPAFTIPPGGHVALTEGLTLGPGDVVRVAAGPGVNVHLYGTEL